METGASEPIDNAADASASTTLRWEFKEVSELKDDYIISRIFFLAGVPWCVGIRAEYATEKENSKQLGIYLFCNDEREHSRNDPEWSVDCKFTLRLCCNNEKGDKGSDFEKEFSNEEYTPCGKWDFVDWLLLMDPKEGFINGDKIIVEVDLTILSTSGIRPQLSVDFTRPPDFGNDSVALRMDDDRVFHVSQMYLATLSPVFRALFYSDFQEAAQPEIAIKEIASEEFEELLHVIYPPYREVTCWSFPRLLALADRYEISSVTDRAEEWLLQTTRVTDSNKLHLADHFRLDRLMTQCLAGIATLQQIKAITTEPEAADYSSDTLRAIMKKTNELID